DRIKAFRLAMRDLGWVEGRNIQIEYRFAGTNLESIKKHVAEVVGLAPDVIVAHSTPVLAVLLPATSTIPILFQIVNDPVGKGILSKPDHPPGHTTGLSFIQSEIVRKLLNLLNDG